MSGQRLYDWWGRNPWALRLLYAVAFLGRESTFRRRGVEALELEPGETVLELGCGPGNSLGRLREAVGPEGRVVGVDYSEGMVKRAARQIDAEGWQNVGAVRGDATRLGVESVRFDAVYASMSLTAMPDPVAAVETAAHCLRPDGRVAVLDARPFQSLPLRLLNPLVVPVSRAATNWDHATDVPAAIESRFEGLSVDSYNDGTVYVAVGRRPLVNGTRPES